MKKLFRMSRFRSTLIAGVATIALTQITAAADLPSEPAPAPELGWTGPYIGLNAGWGWSHDDDIENSVDFTSCDLSINSCNPGISNPTLSDAMAAAVPRSFDTDPDGFIGGGQIGYNLQTDSLVWGIEADFQWANIDGEGSATNAAQVGPPVTSVATVAGTGSQEIDFLGTLRGRLGWAPGPTWLLYVAGGLAYAHTDTDVAFSVNTTSCVNCPTGFTSASNDEWRAGWTIGGGLEWMFAPQWSLKAEYLYYDLGDVKLHNVIAQEVGAPGGSFATVGVSSEADYTGNIARVGINFHF